MAVTFAIDISHHQDKALDLARARADGCELVIIKAGEGSTFVDPDFVANLAEARAAGLLVAAYWYQRSSATAAQHVAKIKATVPADVGVIVDVEANGGGVDLTREIVRQLGAAGYRTPFTYIPRWYWQQLGSPSLAGLPPLWSSRYPDNVVGVLAAEWAAVPASYWDGYGGLPVGLLQFTSSARIAGYAPLDASAFRGTRDQLAAVIGGATLTPLSEEDDMPDRPLQPTPGKPACVTVVVPKTATELVVSVGWVRMYVSKLAFFGPTKPTGLNQLTVPVGNPGDKPFPIDAARSWQVQVPAGAVTAELTYSMAVDADHDTTGVVGFR